ncbi:Developmental pluripotency-associated 5 protein [Galemys pyrenaicus]|uniref:Embryonal stem cell-specific gene 1 protein n=1 Tax=Galemys pyrenaicus TaxID=202257 RepID=A0A8J6AKI7_GALPY|nr:Developmental pluripotency-associated 5 protein [Galemys pyrenaicus]
MGTLPARKDIPPWVKVPEDLKDPEVFQVQTRLLEAIFGPQGSGIPTFEKVSKAMLELNVLESSDLTEVVVYGSYLYKLRSRWMLQSLAEWHRQRQERAVEQDVGMGPCSEIPENLNLRTLGWGSPRNKP